MIPLIFILVYLLLIAFISSFAFRKGKSNTEDFFLASRTIGPMVFFLSLFATNMTAFAILGSSGMANRQGIGVFGLMASSSCFVIPLTIFFIGTRLWAIGKKFGHMTQVSYFRDRWESSGLGTLLFSLMAAMLIPYMIISIMGGGRVLADISAKTDENNKVIMHQVLKPDGSPVMAPVPVMENGKPVMAPVLDKAGAPVLKDGKPEMAPKTELKPKMEAESYVSYWMGCLIVALVVTVSVFFGGMRGTVWVNVFQTIMFLLFGVVALYVISSHLEHGFGFYIKQIAENEKTRFLVTRENMDPAFFWSYTLVPLSSIMFPHMAIMCLSANKVTAFKRTVVLYPFAIMALWLPAVFLGVLASKIVVGQGEPDGVLLRMLGEHAPVWLAGLLGAGIISTVIGSDAHQVLALSTMFTKDIYEHFGGAKKYGERGAVIFARAFIVIVTVFAYIVALMTTASIFELAVRFAFSGFAALAPIMIAALFWKRSTKAGAIASTLWVALCLVVQIVLQFKYESGAIQKGAVLLGSDTLKIFFIHAKSGALLFWNGFLPVFPMVVGSAILMIVVSLVTRPPSEATIKKYVE